MKIRDEGVVHNKAVYLAIGVTRDGTREGLGLWIERSESATFWLRVLTELHSRGVEDILVALVDGLPGFPDALATAFPHTQVHQCTVHLVRQSLTYVHWRSLARRMESRHAAPRHVMVGFPPFNGCLFASSPWISAATPRSSSDVSSAQQPLSRRSHWPVRH